MIYLESPFTNVENDLHIYSSLMVNNCSRERTFSKLKMLTKQQRTTVRQNRLNSLILKSIEHKVLCEIDVTSIINKFTMAKSRKCNRKQYVCSFRQSTSTFILRLHCV